MVAKKAVRIPSLPCGVVLAMLAACAGNPISFGWRSQGEAMSRTRTNAIADGELSVYSRQVLRQLDLETAWTADPGSVIVALEADDEAAERLPQLLALAEASYLLGDRAAERRDAQARFFSAALASVQAIRALFVEGSAFDPRQALLAQIYNRSLARAMTLGQELDGPLAGWETLRTADGPRRLHWRTGPGRWDPAYFDDLVSTEEYAQEGLPNESRRFGLGATFVGSKTNRLGGVRVLQEYPQEINLPVTAILRERGEDLELELLDPFGVEEIPGREGRALPLAANFTTPLACFATETEFHDLTNPGMFDPEEARTVTGLYLMQPYDPNRIPVVLVHGLWSSPLTWLWLLNDLWGDPELRQRYQFWVFAYPTGLPLLLNARSLRLALMEARERFDPQADDPATREMIVIGHSMGGLLSGLLVRNVGDRLWDARTDVPLAELRCSEADRDVVRGLAFHQPLPFVRRAVFMATLHRGSGFADSPVGSLGVALIDIPDELQEMFDRVRRDNPGWMKEEGGRTDRPLTSIEWLSDDSTMLQAIAAAPFAPGLPYHSILGDTEAAGRTGGSDGFVSYDSAHLPGATSERVVKSGHTCTADPAAIREVQRILREHVRTTPF